MCNLGDPMSLSHPVHTYTHVFVCVWYFLCLFVLCVVAGISVGRCLHVYIYIGLRVYIYIYVYTRVHTHIHTHTHADIYVPLSSILGRNCKNRSLS